MSAAELAILIKARDEASGVLNSVGKSSDGLGGKLKALAIAAVAVVGAFVSFQTINNAIDSTQALGDSVHTLQLQTGMTAESASQLIFAFNHVGLSADDAQRSLGIFSKNMTTIQEANDGVAKAAKPTVAVLKEMGITVTDLQGNLLPMQPLLNAVADKFKAMPDGIEKTGLAMQLFGRSGKDMIPLLNLGSAGMAELAAQADKLGLTLSEKNVAQIHDYTLAHRDMEEAITGVKLQIGMALMPKLTELSQWFVAHQPQIREFVDEALAKIGTTIDEARTAITAVMPTFESFGKTVKQGFDVIRPALQWVLDNKVAMVAVFTAIGIAAILAFTPITVPVLAVIAGIVGLIYVIGLMRQHWDELVGVFNRAKQSVLDFIEGHKALVAALVLIFTPIIAVGVLIYELVMHFGELKQAAADAFGAIAGFLSPAIGAISQFVDGVTTRLANVRDAWSAPVKVAFDLIGQYVSGMASVFQTAFGAVVTIVTTQFGIVRDIFLFVLPFIQSLVATSLKVLADLFRAGWAEIQNAVNTALSLLRDTINFILDVISGNWKGAWKDVRSFVSDLFGGVTTDVAIHLLALKKVVQDVALGIGKDLVNFIKDGIDSIIGSLWSKVEDIAKKIADKLNPANWIGSPKGLQNWLPYYYEQGLQNLNAVVSRRAMSVTGAASLVPRSMITGDGGLPVSRGSSSGGTPAVQQVTNITQHIYIDQNQMQGDAAAGFAALAAQYA